jgi:hypothetical protein
MAKKKNGVNKSDAIRQMLAEHPEAKSPEIVSLLAKKGIKVSANLVYFVKARSRARKRKVRRQKAVAASRNAGIANPIELILDVRRLAEKAGGLRQLKQLVDILAE